MECVAASCCLRGGYWGQAMEETEVKSWDGFEPWLQKIESIYDKLMRKDEYKTVSRPLFRGQSNRQWKLLTTLERYFQAPIAVRQYSRLVRAAKPSIETLTGRRWDLPDAPLSEAPRQTRIPARHNLFHGEGYEYLLYLRHHGFPSPLLDWSMSPYLAAFFAFSDVEESTTQHVSIYGFIEYAGGGKGGWASEPQIQGLGSYVRSHARHFLQQSGYTICLRENNDVLEFASHDDVFARGDASQDLLWKLSIPASERRRVLRHLDRHNINAYSLFASEEGMTRTIAFREIEAAIERKILPAPGEKKA